MASLNDKIREIISEVRTERLLTGTVTNSDPLRIEINGDPKIEFSRFFIPREIGIPKINEQLYLMRFSNGYYILGRV